MAIVFILILGFLLRLVNLNQSLWLDEAVQAITSKGTFLNLFAELQGDFHPPLYHLLMWSWAHLFGNGEIAMRLPSVFFGTATIYVVYLIARESYSKTRSPFPYFAALLLATAPFHIYYSQEARTYAMTAFFAALSIYYFLRLVINPALSAGRHRPLIIAYILSTTLLLYSDYYGLFVFLAQMVAVLFIFRRKFIQKRKAFMITSLFFLPCLPLLWVQLKTGSQATAFLPEWGRLVNLSFWKALPLTFIKFSIGRITIFNKKIYALVAAFLFLIYGLIFLNGFFKNKKFRINNLLVIILSWLVVPILLAWLISFFIPNYQPFRLLLVLPAFYLLLVYGISKFFSRKTQVALVIFILVVNLFSLGVYYFNPYFHREDWRGTVRFIEEKGAQNSLALIPSETSHWPYTYYSKGKVPLWGVAQGFNVVQLKDFENESNLKNLTSKIYYIYYLADLFDPQNLIPNWLDKQKFVKIEAVSFNQLEVQIWQEKE